MYIGRWRNWQLPSFQLESGTIRIFLLFIPLYALFTLYARSRSAHDPGSVFFDPWTGYDASYSAIRIEQGDIYIEATDNTTVSGFQKASNEPQLCVGIATVAREGIRYLRSTVGTLLDGLSDEERRTIYLIIFIAHSDPSEHPAYDERWLSELPDQVLLYNEDEVDIDHIRTLEKSPKKVGRQKALLDYQYLLKACNRIATPYVLMLEDDVVAQDGWYHRTQEAIASAESQMKQIGAPDWLYLRLFYSEEFLGWNSEEWPIYLFYSILTVLLVTFLALSARQYKPTLRSHLPNDTILLLAFICTPLLIGLFFAAGRATMLPVPQGVNQMPNFGCCSQAFVFPRSRIPDLLDLYQSKDEGYVDSITEEYANLNQEVRWAITPSIMQHVGRQSSKAQKGSSARPSRYKIKGEMKGAERLWNFAFERNDAHTLRLEHDKAKEELESQ
ncbi:hypothetical protein N7451_010317 [Penicillium sp. IBT 35674x]|nr:hypothetical protein N7451_010317 [Penicillium sp. IBT 35674x]